MAETWLARQMTNAGLAYQQKDNSFTWVQDWEAAQLLLDKQLRTAWAPLLDRWADKSYPSERAVSTARALLLVGARRGISTDIAFRSAEDLQRLYPQLVDFATERLQSPDVLHSWATGREKSGRPRQDLAGEVVTTIKELVEGTYVKHRVLQNSLNMYDKFGPIVRLENLLINVRDFKEYQRRENETRRADGILAVAQGVADMQQRAELGHKSRSALCRGPDHGGGQDAARRIRARPGPADEVERSLGCVR